MTVPLGFWRKADNRSARSHQKLVDAINQQASLSVTGDLSTSASPHGAAVHDERVERWTDMREGLITDTGPAGEADPADATYWVKFAVIDSAASDVEANPTASPPGPTSAGGLGQAELYPVLATNRAEQSAGTHLLPVDGTCWVQLFGDIDAGGAKRYVFSHFPPLVRFGKLKTAWPEFADHNKVTLTRVKSASDATVLLDSTGTPLADITAYIQTPLGNTPLFFAVNVAQIVAYFTDPDGNNILLHCPAPGSNSLYDVIQVTAIVGGLGIGGCGPLKAQ